MVEWYSGWHRALSRRWFFYPQGTAIENRFTLELDSSGREPVLDQFTIDEKDFVVLRRDDPLSNYFEDWRKPTEAERGMFELEFGAPYLKDDDLQRVVEDRHDDPPF